MTMRRSLPSLVLAVLAFSTPALADKEPDITGTFEVKYEDVANNCTNTGIALARGTLKVDKKGKTLQVDIQRFDVMTGVQAKGGKLRASSKVGMSPIDGTTAKASVAGRVEDGMIQLVFVVEFYVNKKPLCTQSWNVTGVRKEALDKAATVDGAAPLGAGSGSLGALPLTGFELLPRID